MKRGWWLGMAALALLGAQGSGLQLAQVPAQATWFAHLDVEQLLQSQTGAKLLAEIQANPNLSARLDAIQNAVGVDLRKDIKSLALFGPDTQKDHGVMVFGGLPSTDRLLTSIRANPSHEELAEGDVTLHKWNDKGHDNYGAILPGGTCLISGHAEAARVTAQMLRSGQGGLSATSTLGGLAKAPAHCILCAAVDARAGLPGGQPQAAVFRRLTGAGLQLTEHEGRLAAELTLLADTAESAARIADVLRGLIAYGQLAEDVPAPWTQLAQVAAVAQSGAQVKVTAGCTADELVQWIKNARVGHPKAQRSAHAGSGS